MLPTIFKRSALPSMTDEFFKNDFFADFQLWNRNASIPSVNIAETNQGYTIELAAPGLSKDDFKINLEDHVLTIWSKKEDNKEEKADKFIRREFSYSSFSRSFSLPEGVNEDKIQANQKDGVLSIEIPKQEEIAPKLSRTIKIS
jgi:HSP20 family protein